MTARASSIRASSVGTSRRRSESPMPRLSNIRTRENAESPTTWSTNSGWSQTVARSDRLPRITTRSTGPEPKSWYAIETSPLRAYRTSGTSTQAFWAAPGTGTTTPMASGSGEGRRAVRTAGIRGAARHAPRAGLARGRATAAREARRSGPGGPSRCSPDRGPSRAPRPPRRRACVGTCSGWCAG